MKSKLMECKSCGKEIATNAKSCPSCGAKNKKPFYKRVWFIVLCVFIVVGAIGSMGDSEDSTSGQASTEQAQQQGTQEQTPEVSDEPVITYEEVSVDDLMETLDGNALKAENTYNEKHLKITGRLGTIDSDGKYISLLPVNDEWAFLGVQCYIENEEQLNQVMEMSTDDIVVLSGQISKVGEIMGYSLDIHTIE